MWIVALLLLLFGFQNTSPFACNWGKPAEAGSLENTINEASGLAISRRIPNRLYHINDSGRTGRFFVTTLEGRNTRTVTVSGFQPRDTEDLAVGTCDATTDCLFIGDIGDNERKRRDIEIIVIEERAEFPAEVRVRNRVRARYPDAPHDAESMAVHPDGSIYILTKNLGLKGLLPIVGPSRLYRLRQDQWRNSRNAIETMELVMTLDLGKLLPGALPGGRLPTGMDISLDGKRLLILTYQDAIEFLVDLSGSPTPDTWKEGQHYRRIPLLVLPQQEAISFTPDGRTFIYTTERRGTDASIMQTRCTSPGD